MSNLNKCKKVIPPLIDTPVACYSEFIQKSQENKIDSKYFVLLSYTTWSMSGKWQIQKNRCFENKMNKLKWN